MMSWADSVIYVNVQKRIRFCKGRVQPKSALNALFVQETLPSWRRPRQRQHCARASPQNSCRWFTFPPNIQSFSPEKS